MTITIVGAGIVGCAIAHALASRGARVRIVDPRGPGGGATGASAGILSPYIEAHGESLLALCIRALDLYDGFIARVRADSARQIPYERTGTLEVARDATGAQSLSAQADRLSVRGVPHTLLTPGAVQQIEPAVQGPVVSGLFVEPHGYVSARALTAALVGASVHRGAAFSRCRVRAIDEVPGGVQVTTDAGTLSSDAVIVAAGSWSGQLAPTPADASPVTPVRGQLVHLRLPAQILSRVIWGPDCYLVPWRDGSVLVGATAEHVGFDERSTAIAVAQLTGAASALVPALASAAFHKVRVGLRPATLDDLPIVGRSSTQPRVFYATGHYRTGVLLAPLTAQLVADLVLDERGAPELGILSPARVGW